jgi:O-acetyl-ADP-ribose deacetylase (regulator of RNase III)
MLSSDQVMEPVITGKLELHLVDADADVAAALARAFAMFPDVHVRVGDLLGEAEHALVSPANSEGFMDGGIDRAIAAFFGSRVEEQVRAAMAARPEGRLPVGASIVVATRHPRVPYLIVAPTMHTPEHVEADHAYRAFRAALRLWSREAALAGPLYCPGLGTGVGGVAPGDAAGAMAEAYGDWLRSCP